MLAVGTLVAMESQDRLVGGCGLRHDQCDHGAVGVVGVLDPGDRAGPGGCVVRDLGDRRGGGGHEDPAGILSAIEESTDLLDDTSDTPVIRLVNLVLSQAVREGASDIHIEPCRDRVRIRKRVDGILYDMYEPPRHAQARLISRVKIMAGMDIAEKRLPQDGRIEIRIAHRNVDIRV